ncbi:MAG: hypothetical protein LBW77_04895, partial [Verrucomicrobiota bacterium]|nr:hypothetical protein [Verrucomicrobiota bacterium]
MKTHLPIGRVFGICAAAGLCAAGCLGPRPGAAPAAPPAPDAASPAASPAAPPAPPPPPAEGYDWDALARMAAANSTEAKALLLEARAERYQTAV